MALNRANASRGSGPQDVPADECRERHHHDRRHEPGRYGVGQPLNRCSRALRLADHPDNLGEHGLAADALGAHHEAASAVQRRAGHARPGFLGHGHGLSSEHRLVDGAAPFNDDPVGRNLLSRPHAQPIAEADVRDRLIGLLATANDARRLRRLIQQLSQRGTRAPAGAQLEHLAEYHQHGHDDGGVEISFDRATVHAQRGRKELRRDRADGAVEPRRADAERDEREHVRLSGFDRRPPALEKRPASPKHHRRRTDEAEPVDESHQRAFMRRADHERLRTTKQTDHLSHRQQKHRGAQNGGNPQAACHVHELGIGSVVERDGHRLERHAAFRAGPRPVLHDLRVHGTRVQRIRCHRRGRLAARLQKRLRIGLEAVQTRRIAEVVGRPPILVRARGGRGLNGHAADGINRHFISPARSSRIGQSGRRSPWQCSTSWLSVRRIAWSSSIF